MSDLRADEKVCPFCAETIKAAAIKCRFCHSDLPDVGTQPAPAERPDTVSALTSPAGSSTQVVPAGSAVPVEPGSAPARTGAVVTGMLVACLVFAAATSWLLWQGRSENNVRADGLRIGSHGQVVTPTYRDSAMGAAAQHAALVFSYSYKTLSQDESEARAVMSPAFLDQYAAVMRKATPKALSARLTLTASAVGTSLVSIEPDKAVALLFVNTVTTSGDSPKQQLDENRVLMTMTRKDGNWIVSKIDAF